MSQATLQAVEQLAMQLTDQEQLILLERLASSRRYRAHDASGPKDLYGAWRGSVDDDFDLDAVLNEIRTEWMEELRELDE